MRCHVQGCSGENLAMKNYQNYWRPCFNMGIDNSRLMMGRAFHMSEFEIHCQSLKFTVWLRNSRPVIDLSLSYGTSNLHSGNCFRSTSLHSLILIIQAHFTLAVFAHIAWAPLIPSNLFMKHLLTKLFLDCSLVSSFLSFILLNSVSSGNPFFYPQQHHKLVFVYQYNFGLCFKLLCFVHFVLPSCSCCKVYNK